MHKVYIDSRINFLDFFSMDRMPDSKILDKIKGISQVKPFIRLSSIGHMTLQDLYIKNILDILIANKKHLKDTKDEEEVKTILFTMYVLDYKLKQELKKIESEFPGKIEFIQKQTLSNSYINYIEEMLYHEIEEIKLKNKEKYITELVKKTILTFIMVTSNEIKPFKDRFFELYELAKTNETKQTLYLQFSFSIFNQYYWYLNSDVIIDLPDVVLESCKQDLINNINKLLENRNKFEEFPQFFEGFYE